ncbi:MAG TPA: nucleotide sugar dehydrogenase [Verrucomicrobiae bacterium]|jgi:UDP-N-acetyl-D-glucosamine dehydrogenase|nr:nucleotide sugar dehydrogenase [Verrucomicrobiae bacterium]
MEKTALNQTLEQKIQTKTIRAGIIGLGYVGLPLAVEFAHAGIRVTGIDVDTRKVASVNEGKSYIQDVPQNTLKDLTSAKKLSATTDFSVISELDTVNICVPTPLRKSKDPDMSYIVAAAEQIAKYVHPGMLVILESTTYPGTTEEVILPMLEDTGLKVGKDFFLAFSPERVDPGNATYHTRNIPKVVGGVTPQCTELARQFYALAIEKVHVVSSTQSAEMVKLLENTFRSVNIGLVNEMCQMSEKLGVNIWEIIEAAATKPFGFMPFFPGPGLGGHCIPIDPHYLAWKARSTGFSPRFIDLADAVNSNMPEFVVRKAQTILNRSSKPLRGTSVHVLGVTYKKNVSDFRESPAFHIIEMLEHEGAKVSYTDPYVPELITAGTAYKSVNLDSQPVKADLAILVTDHDLFDRKQLVEKFPVILDTRNFFKGANSEKVVRL